MTGYVQDPKIDAVAETASLHLEEYADASWLEWGRRILPKLAREVAAASARASKDPAQLFIDGELSETEYFAEVVVETDNSDDDGTDVKMEVDDTGEVGAGKGKGKAGSPIEIEDQAAEYDAPGGGDETPVATPKRPSRAKAKSKGAVAPTIKKERTSDKVQAAPEAVKVRLQYSFCIPPLCQFYNR